jgi:hypothetical protein
LMEIVKEAIKNMPQMGQMWQKWQKMKEEWASHGFFKRFEDTQKN